MLWNRFMMVPRATMDEKLKGEEKELSDDIANLQKKVRHGSSID